MRHTLKAFFAHQSDAQHVVDELLASGYSNVDTALSSDLPTGGDDRYPFVGEDATAGGPVKRFAARLFGSGQHQQSAAYRDAIVQGRHVVTLAADSEPDVARAVAVIERFGPVRIEDHDDESDHGRVDADAGRAGTRHSYPPGTEPGALQDRAHEDSRYFGTQRADAPPTGNTFQETMGADSQWVHPDDGRLHVPAPATISDSNSAVHDDEMAAYRYGKEMRISDMYRNRSWNEVEPSLKNGWEARSNSALTWDEAGTTVRQGWDSTSPDIDDDDRSTAGRDGLGAAHEAPTMGGAAPTWDKVKAAVRHGWERVRS